MYEIPVSFDIVSDLTEEEILDELAKSTERINSIFENQSAPYNQPYAHMYNDKFDYNWVEGHGMTSLKDPEIETIPRGRAHTKRFKITKTRGKLKMETAK